MRATSTSLAWHIRQDMGALKAHLSGRKGTRSELHVTIVSFKAVFWILRTGAPWRDLFFQTMEIGKTPIAGFATGEIRGDAARILVTGPDFEWLMTDASHIR